MKLETHISQTTEVFVTGDGISVTANPWANHEGLSVMIHGEGKHMPIRAAFSLRWEEMDALIVAMTAARAA
ncbi:MAG: hypothetical protein Q8L99_08490 [Polycyclovorans sp.]|nr:hypothetical protein [Polycyclovorans sp.]